jgi:hypothetical protein
MAKEINATLQQQGKLGQLREYQIVNGKELRIIQGMGAKQRVYLVHLLALGDKSRVRFNIAWGWLYLAVACLVGLVIYLMVKSLITINSGMIEFAIMAAFILGIALGLILVIANFSRVRVFYSRHSAIPLFDLYISKPNQQAYKSFLRQLNNYIEKTREFWKLKLDQQIAGEVRMLRRLASDGVISQRDYDQAKDRLFSISNKKSRA